MCGESRKHGSEGAVAQECATATRPILYLLKSGCQWDMLPSDFPKKSTVYYYFKLWKDKPSEDELSLLEQALKKCGWRGPRQQWTEREHDFRDR